MKFKFFSITKELDSAWRKYLGDLDCVSIHTGNILNEPTDCVVSPANSFGFMDGGIDLVYKNYFGQLIEILVQYDIQTYFNGELPVGQSFVTYTRNKIIPYIIVAPTMRIPTALPKNTDVPYMVMRSILLMIMRRTYPFNFPTDQIKTISIPGFGTGVGGVDPELCAAQVRKAFDDIWFDKFVFPKNFNDMVLPFTNRTLGDYK